MEIPGGRRPLYKGGERGIRNRSDVVTRSLRVFAKSDFAHDFGENVSTRDQFTRDDIERFTEIAQRFGVGLVKSLIAGFDGVNGQNPYKLIQNNISAIYPGVQSDDVAEFMTEPVVLQNAGIDYDSKFPTSLKSRLKKEMAGKTKAQILASPIVLTQAVNIPGDVKKWQYDIRAVPMKDDAKKTPNISAMFHSITGGKTSFALIIDAAGGLTMTSLKNSDLGASPPDQKCTFYIIENIENDSDSATKLKNFDKPKIDTPERVSKAPDVFFLKDVQDTVVYPMFNPFTQESQGEVLFGNAELTLSRAGEEMEADFKFDDGTKYHIENVSQNGNVKNASLNLLAAAIAAGGKVVVKGKEAKIEWPPGAIPKQPLLYPYIKRVGDWCQALSLLDTSRTYQEYDTNHNIREGQKKTLRELKEAGTEVALVTLDRILLAYALSLGIDVFFTTASDLTLLLFFKNTETELSDAQIAEQNAKFEADIAELNTADAVLKRADNSASVIASAEASVGSARDDADYISRLRAALYRMSMRRSDFPSLDIKVKELDAKLATTADAKVRHNLYFDKLTILRKMIVDHAHNNAQVADIATYPGIEEDNVHYDIMRSRQSRNTITRLKVVISKEMYNDALQAPPGEFQKLYREPANIKEYGDVWKAFGDLKRLTAKAGVMKGGAPLTIEQGMEALGQFEVTPLTQSAYAAVAKDPASAALYQEQPLALIVGSYYRDKKTLPYTVIDKHVITKEDLNTFEDMLPAVAASGDLLRVQYLALRFMLLYVDTLQSAYEKLIASEDNDKYEDPTAAITNAPILKESSVKFANHKLIHYRANSLLNFITSKPLVTIDDYKTAFAATYREMTRVIGDDELDVISSGRGALRNTFKDDAGNYVRTREKIQTVRKEILRVFKIATFQPGQFKNEIIPDVAAQDPDAEDVKRRKDGPSVDDLNKADQEVGVDPVAPGAMEEVEPLFPAVVPRPLIAPAAPPKDHVMDLGTRPGKRPREGGKRRTYRRKSHGKKTRKH